LKLVDDIGSFDDYIWSFVGGKPIVNRWKQSGQIPATSKESDALAADLKKRGFKFVGSTVMYAHLQAAGLINDHLVDCPRWREVGKKTR
jgi:DNA-3-methyladenine glycosylase I